MKVDIEKSKKLVKLSILALLLTYAAFFCYGAIMAFDFCNGPMGQVYCITVMPLE